MTKMNESKQMERGPQQEPVEYGLSQLTQQSSTGSIHWDKPKAF